ncbi:MAG: nucleotide sugar dehydrogenase [Flavobacteriia bacterium]|nr:nucleotide sugar dehydrogenase [Flavobacteriia bacterium]OIP47572.1 MAG: UDP-N-acetyl-D-galactosamine dehydrogenase [Flavobacteriaceae bacterium CG2_30_31_66]PIV97970.1 MAG: nucleotide sugar dehydrogenase [Flavobacteriaceae bacterium CG17_big_fil_post_rev_8_21_14_2_50_31_13]PIX13460.1 MAG: nucleotide sugar dehydrogenase [Flavobacteriaceae bacterium CG_4_8_14_3_um_filter_31_8]PIY15836.1 MAG: nucleotide sugar dehydrogenase [Flavobacteriaceae bacterium CG_4_10_14_3_um_filter_31_253]PIZ09827.1 
MNNTRIAIIGLGYVGLPLARLFATKYFVVGYDIKIKRVNELKKGIDTTLEVGSQLLQSVLTEEMNAEKGLYITSDESLLKTCNHYIVTVPTSVDKNNQPDLQPLLSASKTIAKYLKKNDLVIYESTVYPGATEEDCIPVLEKESGLIFNKDFFVGYSPERISPGDKIKTVENILKVTSGSTPESAQKVNNLYKSVIVTGTHLAPSIKVAEAAKIIENCQRDINIAFVNELSKIFSLMNINTSEVLEAAGTKWNFLPFKPGLVGGHCIGVDPFYLAQKAQQYGYYPEIILSGRRLNDSMGTHVASEIIKLMIDREVKVKGAKVLVLGITFKENCPDIRNTKVVDMLLSLNSFGVKTSVYDPWAKRDEVKREYGFELLNEVYKTKYDAIVLAVSHNEFKTIDIPKLKKKNSVVYDIKNFLDVKDKSL